MRPERHESDRGKEEENWHGYKGNDAIALHESDAVAGRRYVDSRFDEGKGVFLRF